MRRERLSSARPAGVLFRLLAGFCGVLLATGIAIAIAAPDGGTRRVKIKLPTNRRAAPAFPDGFQWLNTDRPLSVAKDLKGQVVVLDFWTYCCINCMQALPDLEYIEEKFAGQPVLVVGVHSAKFENEKDAANIRAAIHRYRIKHPVLVDKEMSVWQRYGVRAWPTFVFIDPAGQVVGAVSGEGHRKLIEQVVAALLDEGREKGTLARGPLTLATGWEKRDRSMLSFPGKVTADPDGKRLFVSDSNHNRILVVDPAGKVLRVIGSGQRGLKDGPFVDAQFANPQGTALDGKTLYVADTDNHAVRKVDLGAGTVTTLAGNGKQSYDRIGGGKGTAQPLASPWDVALHQGRLYVAMAGLHQLWVCDLKTFVTRAWTGSGGENIIDGPPRSAQLAQPSGLAILDGHIYFADSEVSGIRRASLKTGEVETLIGTGLFEFGFQDGKWKEAKLQHPLGVAVRDGRLLVADSYNHRVRELDLKKRTIRTLLGDEKGALFEPSGLAVLDGALYIADTNHHRILRFDPKTRKSEALPIAVPAGK